MQKIFPREKKWHTKPGRIRVAPRRTKKKQKHNERTQSHREIEDPRRGL